MKVGATLTLGHVRGNDFKQSARFAVTLGAPRCDAATPQRAGARRTGFGRFADAGDDAPAIPARRRLP
jgi:hypothetical protein